MPFRITDVPKMDAMVDKIVFGHIDHMKKATYVLGVTNYDTNGYVLDYNRDGNIEWDILAAYLTETHEIRDGVYGEWLDEHYLRISDLSAKIRSSIITKI